MSQGPGDRGPQQPLDATIAQRLLAVRQPVAEPAVAVPPQGCSSASSLQAARTPIGQGKFLKFNFCSCQGFPHLSINSAHSQVQLILRLDIYSAPERALMPWKGCDPMNPTLGLGDRVRQTPRRAPAAPANQPTRTHLPRTHLPLQPCLALRVLGTGGRENSLV